MALSVQHLPARRRPDPGRRHRRQHPGRPGGCCRSRTCVDVGAKFQVQRLFPARAAAGARVRVYDTAGRQEADRVRVRRPRSTPGQPAPATTFTLQNASQALTGDVQVAANVDEQQPRLDQALTFAVKSLVGGSTGVPATEADPMAGAVQMSPFPNKLTDGRSPDPHASRGPGHLQRSTPRRRRSSTRSIDQDHHDDARRATAASPRRSTSCRTSVTVDLVRRVRSRASTTRRARRSTTSWPATRPRRTWRTPARSPGASTR